MSLRSLATRPMSVAGPAAPAVDDTAWVVTVCRLTLFIITFFAVGTFNPKIVPNGDTTSFNQYVTLLGWFLIIAVSYFRRPIIVVEATLGFVLALLFYGYAMISVAWSVNPMSGIPKAIALMITMFGAYRATRVLAVDDILESVLRGIFVLCVVTIALVIVKPDLAIMSQADDWLHPGQWMGIFGTKQTLGITSGHLIFLSSVQLLRRPGHRFYMLAIAVAAICVINSGSRGGGALAVVAIICAILAMRSVVIARFLTWSPMLILAAGTTIIGYFMVTGNKAFLFIAPDANLTERTFIWQYALSYYVDRPFLGFGLNGFWTEPLVKARYIEQYKWFLDNYHNGFIAVLVELGIVGYALFIIMYLFYCARINDNITRDSGLSIDQAGVFVYTLLAFFIDVTETFFLRSTNIVSTLMFVGIFVAYSRPIGARVSEMSGQGRDVAASAPKARPW